MGILLLATLMMSVLSVTPLVLASQLEKLEGWDAKLKRWRQVTFRDGWKTNT
ncbi:MAG: hypothetical protein N3D12_06350 [Candidatus Methanomethyliaceae archaeon]|nr:hypothetical protein [Candidatus Methanomethyliaceae archaeon]